MLSALQEIQGSMRLKQNAQKMEQHTFADASHAREKMDESAIQIEKSVYIPDDSALGHD